MCITILVVGRASPRLLLVPTWEVSVYQSLADQKAARGLRAASSSIRGGWLFALCSLIICSLRLDMPEIEC